MTGRGLVSRVAFFFGLVVSTGIHVWLLSLPGSPPVSVVPPIVVPVIETELARVDPVEPTEVETPEPEPQSEPEPEPAPEQPMLTEAAKAPETEVTQEGDFAGAPDGDREPLLRIDWGPVEQAMATIQAGEMVMVVLTVDGPKPTISQQIVLDDGAWLRRPSRNPDSTRFSNRLRIVDHVPGFSEVQEAVGLTGSERLAVLLPMRVERVLESAQMEAAFHRGLVMNQIDNFAGRFAMRDGKLDFDITHVREYERSASP